MFFYFGLPFCLLFYFFVFSRTFLLPLILQWKSSPGKKIIKLNSDVERWLFVFGIIKTAESLFLGGSFSPSVGTPALFIVGILNSKVIRERASQIETPSHTRALMNMGH
jgi:hypothetical protein